MARKPPRLVHLSLSRESTLDTADGTHHLHSVANNLLRAILCEVVLGSAIGLSAWDGYSSGGTFPFAHRRAGHCSKVNSL
jgi:hypothetical protein